jgi:excisionase family DNA binding protein
VTATAPTAGRLADGAQVRALRRARGLSQAQLGAAAGVGQGSISKIEHGGINRPAWLPALAAALGVAERDLLAASTAPRASAAAPAPPGDLYGLELMTVAEVAAVLRVSTMTVYRLVHTGVLEAIRAGRSFRIPGPAVTAYLHRAHVGGPPTPQPPAASGAARPVGHR